MSERAQTRRGGDGAGDRARRRESGRSQRVSHQHPLLTRSTPGDLQDISRLREAIGQLQIEGRGFDREEGLRWKINQLEQEKLELSSKYNQELSSSEAQLTRCRALLEKGEAQRQTLEYELAVVKRDAAAQKSRAEDKMADLITHNQQLEGLSAELRQRASDLQRALEITQQARIDDEQGLQTELCERDHLIHSISTEKELLQEENRRLDTLLQEQKDTLQELRVRRAELRNGLEMKKELELRLRDVKAALTVEERNRAETASSLELITNQYRELERTHTLARERAQHTLALAKQEYQNTKAKLIGQLEHEKAESAKLIGQLEHEKAESAKLIGQLEHEKAESAKLIGQLEHEKAESAKLSIRLQKQEGVETEKAEQLDLGQKRLAFVEEAHGGLLKEIEQLLHHYHHQGAPPINSTGDKQSSSALMDVLRRVLHHYHTELKDLVKVVDTLNKENKDKDEIIADQRRRIQDCEAQCVCVSEEAERLRVYVKDAADAAQRAQTELQSVTHRWEEERQQHTHTKTHKHTLTQEHQRKQQEKLAFLHSLYQRLLTGCVWVAPPQSMMGSYSWAELSVMLQEQADSLTSDLESANQRIVCLDSVCEGKEAALKSVCEQLKQREKSWIKQRDELNTQHTHLINQLHTRAQDLSSRLDHTEERLRVSERAHSALQQEVGGLQQLVCVCRRDEMSFLAACAMLAGCVCALHGRVCALVCQKALLQRRVCDAESLQKEVRALLSALSDSEVKGQREVRGCVWKFRVCVIVVMAALRLSALGRNTHTLFRVRDGVCVSTLRLSNTHIEEEQNDKVMKMLTSSQLCVTLHTCMQELQTELQRTERSVCVLAAARSSFSKLMEKLLCEREAAGCYGDVGSLTQRLNHGLHNLQKTHHLPLTHHSNTVMFSALQKHFLVFTQRLHSAEVERRDLRMKLSHLKRRNTHKEIKDNTHSHTETKDNTQTQFRSVCEELRSALHREQQAQTLLHEQATQLQELGVTMETHTSEQLEKDQTLTQAVQSLSDVKAELKRKEQSLRLLEKRLSQSQREKQELQQSMNRAEHTLHMAARSKECLLSYMLSVECSVRELKDRLLSHSTSSRDDFTLLLPTMQRDTREPSAWAAEVKACQALVKSFTVVYELACSKMACLDRKTSSYLSHITTSVRDNQYQLMGCTDALAPVSEAEGTCGIASLWAAGAAVKDVPETNTLQNKSSVSLKKSRAVKTSSNICTSVTRTSKTPNLPFH